MSQPSARDRPVAVVGSGPNGLAAAVTLATRGVPVRVYEANPTPGGGARTAQLTRPGYLHDVCSAVHPTALVSPFFRSLEPGAGVRWVHPARPLAHPFDDGTAAVLDRSVAYTAESLDAVDASAYRALMKPFVGAWQELFEEVLAPPLHLPRHPLLLARFGLYALRSARSLAESQFSAPRARALFAGLGAHALEPLETAPTAGVAMTLAVAGHAVGWPFAEGGSGQIASALVGRLLAEGGDIRTSHRIDSLDELDECEAILLDLTPVQALRVARGRFSRRYARQLKRYRYGPGSYKVDWALSEPIPWRAPECREAGTVHLGGTLEEVADATRAPSRGDVSERPFVLLAQPSLFDSTRTPPDGHVAWAYAHVPHRSPADCAEAIEAQVERFAPGFRDTILARSSSTARDLEDGNANLVGGDINGGRQDLRQTFFRPAIRLNPYTTPDPRVYLCSASTPPGGGVHGMCGHLAARTALRRLKL